MDIVTDELLPMNIIKKNKKEENKKKLEKKPQLSETIDPYFDAEFVKTFFTLNKLPTVSDNKKH